MYASIVQYTTDLSNDLLHEEGLGMLTVWGGLCALGRSANAALGSISRLESDGRWHTELTKHQRYHLLTGDRRQARSIASGPVIPQK
jgi:hypothetical protein